MLIQHNTILFQRNRAKSPFMRWKKKKKKKIKILTSQCENSSRDTCFQECLGGLVTAKSPNSSAALWNSGTPRNLFHCISNPSTKNPMHIFHYLEQTFKNLANCPYKSKRKKTESISQLKRSSTLRSIGHAMQKSKIRNQSNLLLFSTKSNNAIHTFTKISIIQTQIQLTKPNYTHIYVWSGSSLLYGEEHRNWPCWRGESGERRCNLNPNRKSQAEASSWRALDLHFPFLSSSSRLRLLLPLLSYLSSSLRFSAPPF